MGDRAAAVKFFNAALSGVQDENNPNRYTHAYQLFASAALTDPTWAQALYQAGCNCGDLEHKEAAVACFRRALECESTEEERGKAMTNLGWKLHQLGRTKEAEAYSLEAIKIVPHMPYAWVNLSVINQVLCNT
jgi:tetratricopeptide (TPR) repeat protein